MSISFQKSLEAREGMRETLEAAETFVPIAAPIAVAARVVGNVAAAIITPVVSNVCNFNSETADFCKGFVRPAKDLAERMAAVPDPLKTDYGFSEEEAGRFHETTGDVATAFTASIPFILRTANHSLRGVGSAIVEEGGSASVPATLRPSADLTTVYIPKRAVSGSANYKQYWCHDLYAVDSRFEGVLIDGSLRLIECDSKKILLLTIDNLKAAPGSPSTLFFIKELPRLGQIYGADKIFVRASFFQHPESGYFGGDLYRALNRRYKLQPTEVSKEIVNRHGFFNAKFYELPIRSSILPIPLAGLFIDSDEFDTGLFHDRTESLATTHFRHARVDVKSERISVVSHEEGDRITSALNRMSVEEKALREFEDEIRGFCDYIKAEGKAEDRARDRVRLQGALSDVALAALRFGAPRLEALFQAGHEMMRLEESVRRVQGVGSFASMDGALAIGSVAGTGMAVINAFASLDRESEDVFGPLMQGMREYNASLCSQVQEICRQTAYFHEETVWEFSRARNELVTMYEELKAIQVQVTKEAGFLKQDIAIGFLRVQRELDLFRREIGYQVQELRLEELRQVEDGINHYEFGAVSLDKVREWASVIERWMTNPPFKKMMIGRTIGFLAEAAKTKGVVEIEEASIDAFINLDTLEALLPAYTTVLKMLREAGVVYDSESVLWQKMVLSPVNACEVVFNKLEEKRVQIETAFADSEEMLQAFREHFTSYKAQIVRIRRSAQAKKEEIKAMPCVMRSAEKFSAAAAKLDESEELLASKLQALIAALAARK